MAEPRTRTPSDVSALVWAGQPATSAPTGSADTFMTEQG